MSTLPILIIDDEPDICELVSLTLNQWGYESSTANSYAAAIELIDNNSYSLCLTDMRLPDGNGLDIVSHLNQYHETTPVAVITAHGNMDSAIDALKRGAFDFITKPIELEYLRRLVTSAVGLPKTADESELEKGSSRLIGSSTTAQQLRKQLVKVARSQAPVCILGESGSGKEVCARLIHEHSARKDAPFVAINCGAIPAELVESEFFGHKKGAFTGAISDEPGLFVSANGGTLLLDEVADLPLAMQVKLLRAIQEKHVRPVGGNEEVSFDVRIISATHKNLNHLVSENQFRNDLFYRINVIEIHVPPLRERADDILPIANKLLERIVDEMGLPLVSLTDAAVNKLKNHNFPGNVRELENTLERTVALCEKSIIDSDDLIFQSVAAIDDDTINKEKPANSTTIDSGFNPSALSLDEFLEQVERTEIQRALEHKRWNKTETAKYLGMTFRSLRYRLKKLGLDD